MNTRWMPIVAGTLFLLLGLAGGAWFLYHFERVEESVEGPPHSDFLRRPFVGMQHFLEKSGVEMREVSSLTDPRALEGTELAILDAEAMSMTTWGAEAMRAWAEAGGHLILVEPIRVDREEELMEALGARWVTDLPGEVPGVAYGYYPISRGGRSVFVPDEVDFVAFTTGEWQGSREPVIYATGPFGEGRLTIWASAMSLQNAEVSEELGVVLAELLGQTEEWPSRGVMYMEHQALTWYGRVMRTGWPVWTAILMMLLFGLTRARRFGPRVPEPDRRRRQRAEHVRAMGRFLWHHHATDKLLKATRRALVQAVARRRPSVLNLSGAKRYALMAEELKVREDEIRHLMESYDVITNRETFREVIGRMETLRRSL